MNAGKSTALLQVAFNYEERGHQVRIFTSDLDTRSKNHILSRLGVSRQAETFSDTTDFSEALAREKSSCILIDEAQFLTKKQVYDLHKFAHTQNIPIICYGLRSDFQGEPFPGSTYLLTLADSLEELKTICNCGKKATMNVRITKDGKRVTKGKQIGIEGDFLYTQACASCFYLKNTFLV